MTESRKEFLERRQQGIGGSDVAAILGLSKWATPLDVWKSKIEPIEDANEDTPDYIHFGNVLEDVVAQEFSRRSGLKVQRRNKLFKHPEHEFLIANIDRRVIGERAGLECKTSSAWMNNEWGESGTDHIPLPYTLQVAHYMNVTGIRKWYLGALIGGNDYRTYVIPYNETLAEHIKTKCIEFWEDYVLPQVPPPPVNLDDVAKLYETSKDVVTVPATDNVIDDVERLRAVDEKLKKLDKEKDALKLAIQEHMKNANTLLDPTNGDVLAIWKSSESNRFQTTEFKKAYPEMYNEFTTLTESRRFLLKKIKETK